MKLIVPSKLGLIISVCCIILWINEVGIIEVEVSSAVTVKISNMKKNPYIFLGTVVVSSLFFDSAIFLKRQHIMVLRFGKPSIL